MFNQDQGQPKFIINTTVTRTAERQTKCAEIRNPQILDKEIQVNLGIQIDGKQTI